jgi:hypothetical protein
MIDHFAYDALARVRSPSTGEGVAAMAATAKVAIASIAGRNGSIGANRILDLTVAA